MEYGVCVEVVGELVVDWDEYVEVDYVSCDCDV